uniref:Nodule Cysteine-Rich (NCR) secreted peptide n=1 Tax=Caenorhabditis tropicalis TaxID=1561998 RepID=A0A1I7V3G6_9PELO
MKSCLIFLFIFILFYGSNAASTTPDVCLQLKCKVDEVCDREAVECVNKNDMTEGRPCEKHEDCRDDHICYVGRCIFFIGRQ